MKTITSEFSLENDEFQEARCKGVKSWIKKHIFYRNNKYLLILFLFLTIIATYLSAMIMIIVGLGIDGFNRGDNNQVLFIFVLLLLFGIGAPLIVLSANFFREILAQRLERDVRGEFYLNLLGKSQSFHDNQRIGDIMARSTADVRVLSFLISPAIAVLFSASFYIIIPIVLITLFYSLELVFLPLVFSVLFILYLKLYMRKLAPVTEQRRMAFGDMNAVLNEELSGIEIIKSMAQEEQSVEKYKDSAVSYRDWGIKLGYIQARYMPILFISFVITLGLIHSIFLYKAGKISIGDIIGYIGLLFLLRIPVFNSIDSLLLVQEASAGAERLIETMNQTTEINENINAEFHQIKGNIKFDNVSFIYPGTKKVTLRNINFEVRQGQTFALVGITGAGKTTLTKLVSRLYDVSEGRILIDGIDVRDYALQSLRNQIAFIEQDVFLFSKSISENISFGRNVSKDKIIAAAKEAQAHDFIINLINGYDTVIGERGVTLSGGERQRIAIARAFLSDPRILILDDSSSALDSETEERIQTAISRILKGRTTLIITHRLSQIRSADHIIVLKQGQIEEQGSHESLLKTSKEYRNIFVKRFNNSFSELLGESA